MTLWNLSGLTERESGSLDRIVQRRGFYPVLEMIVSTLMAEVSENTDIDDDERFHLEQTAQQLHSIIENE